MTGLHFYKFSTLLQSNVRIRTSAIFLIFKGAELSLNMRDHRFKIFDIQTYKCLNLKMRLVKLQLAKKSTVYLDLIKTKGVSQW